MKKRLLLVLFVLMIVFSCSAEKTAVEVQNPFFAEFDTPFGVPPFDKIKVEHYLPAFEKAIASHKEEIDAIINNPEEPTFENTLVALDRSGEMLGTVSSVFFGQNSANTNEDMQNIAKEVAPRLSEHRDNIMMDPGLFKRVKAVYEKKDDLDLDEESAMLLDEVYKQFVRGGADLGEEDKAKLREINKELSVLTLQFGENILKETNKFEMVIDNEEDLAGLPEGVIKMAAEDASKRGHEGKWLFTLNKPSMIPFLQYSEKRNLREKIYKGYLNRGNNNDELDNKEILKKIANLRVKKAHIMGFDTHADFVLDENMAKKPENVYALLEKLWKPGLKRAKEERAAMQKMIDDEGGDFKLRSWDWWYYAEKVKKAKYDLDEEMLRPYFQMENVRKGVFDLASRLFGITFEEKFDLPKYHEDVRTYEVKDEDGSHIGVLYTDYFPRESKRGGAWMGSYREQSRIGGKRIAPVCVNVGNFSKPTADKPALLSWDDVLTLFHEFGHGLHGLLTDCKYERLSGTAVAQDFVELPSQIMENWAKEPEMLKMYAKHYETGEPMPDELIEKIKKSAHFNQGFAITEYLAASILDMDYHTMKETKDFTVLDFEKKSMDRIGLIPEIPPRYRSFYFAHIFSGGYSAGYYSYIWAEVLDADAFQAFKETGDIFNREVAMAFRHNVLERGGSAEPMELYKRFRGAKPSIDPLLERRGLN